MSTLPVFFSAIEPSGKVRQTGLHSNMEDLVFDGCIVVYREAPDNTYYKDGDFVSYPKRPSFWHSFDYQSGSWFDPRSLDDLRSAQWISIKQRRSEIQSGLFSYMGKMIQVDPESVRSIQLRADKARDALSAGDELLTEWTAYDNSKLSMDAAQMAAMPGAISDFIEGLHEIARGLRDRLANAATPAEVAAVRWPESSDDA